MKAGAAPPLFSEASARRRAWLGGTALVLAALAANRQVLGFPFLLLMDDDTNVTLNPHLGGLTWAHWQWVFSDWSYVRRYMPVGWLTFDGLHGLAGFSAPVFHAAALAALAVNAALVFLLLLLVLRVYGGPFSAHGLAPWPVTGALVGAAWWTFHPLRVESTAWVSGLLYGESTAFFLGGLCAYLQSLRCLAAGEGRRPWLVAAWLLLALSLLTYPLALGTPVLLLALDRLFLRSCRTPPAPWTRRLLLEKIAFVGPSLLAAGAAMAARLRAPESWGHLPTWSEFPLMARVAQSAYLAAYYLWRPWWPFHLSVTYDTLFTITPASATFLAPVGLVLALSAGSLAAVRRHPWLLATWVSYLALAAPFFGLTEQPHMSSDRYGYFLTVFTAALLAAAWARLERPAARGAALAGALLLLAGLGRLAWQQTWVWSDSRTLYARVVESLPPGELHENYAARQRVVDLLEGRATPPRAVLADSLKRYPRSSGLLLAQSLLPVAAQSDGRPLVLLAALHEGLGLQFARSGELRLAQEHLAWAVALYPPDFQAAYNLAWTLLRTSEPPAALHAFLWATARGGAKVTPPERAAFLAAYRRAVAEGATPATR